MIICKMCVNNHDINANGICSECNKMLEVSNFDQATKYNYPNELTFEFINFIKERSGKSLLYAYSGGQDSTAVLFKLKSLCDKYSVNLKVFTIDNGFKGEKTWRNIYNCIRFMNLENNFRVYDIKNVIINNEHVSALFGSNHTVQEVYALLFFHEILPCGKLCNSIMDEKYKDIMAEEKEEFLVTGGDTPKLNNGRYSIFWVKNNGIKIVRGGAGLRINKQIGRKIIEDNSIPWENPGYGGYDTDCLLPGSILSSRNDSRKQTSIEEIDRDYHVVLEFFKERVRLGVIDREEAIRALAELDICDYSGFVEIFHNASKVLKMRGYK